MSKYYQYFPKNKRDFCRFPPQNRSQVSTLTPKFLLKNIIHQKIKYNTINGEKFFLDKVTLYDIILLVIKTFFEVLYEKVFK